MANKRIAKRRKKGKQKVTHSTSDAPLCALGEVLKEKAFFEPIHQTVDIHQKTIRNLMPYLTWEALMISVRQKTVNC